MYGAVCICFCPMLLHLFMSLYKCPSLYGISCVSVFMYVRLVMLYVCMDVCIFVYMYVCLCLYVCMHVALSVCLYVCIFLCMRRYIDVCTYV